MTSLGLVTQGYFSAGGVQSVARWLKDVAEANSYTVTVYDLATARNDSNSRRAADPRTWLHAPRIVPSEDERGVFHVGASLAELEPARYLPRRHLTAALDSHDVIQVVAGAGSLAAAAAFTKTPIALQPATMLRWERDAKRDGQSPYRRAWSDVMTHVSLPVERYALKRADAVLVHNSAIQSQLHHMGIEAVVAPTGVDTSVFRTAERPYSATGPIVCVGRLNEPRKALHVLIDAFQMLREMGDSRRLVLAGRGTLPSGLRQQIHASGLDDWVDVRTDLSQHDLVELLQSASVFAQSSREEGLGIAVLEAMACGVPVVATRTAGTDMTVTPGINGELCAQDNPTGLAKAIASLTPDRALVMSRNARRIAQEQFSIQAAARPFLKVWSDLVER